MSIARDGVLEHRWHLGTHHVIHTCFPCLEPANWTRKCCQRQNGQEQAFQRTEGLGRLCEDPSRHHFLEQAGALRCTRPVMRRRPAKILGSRTLNPRHVTAVGRMGGRGRPQSPTAGVRCASRHRARRSELADPHPVGVPVGLAAEQVAKDINRAQGGRGWAVTGGPSRSTRARTCANTSPASRSTTAQARCTSRMATAATWTSRRSVASATHGNYPDWIDYNLLGTSQGG